MANNTHKGSELRNVSDTWDQNEKEREASGGAPNSAGNNADESSSELEQVVKQEAAEYDNDDKENRVLGGERASINDTDTSAAEE